MINTLQNSGIYSSAVDTRHTYMAAAILFMVLAIWLLARTVAPIVPVLRVVSTAVLAFVAIGAALAVVAIALIGQ